MEQILEKLGAPGHYHCLIVILFAITWWSVTLGTVSMAFYGYTPNKTCITPSRWTDDVGSKDNGLTNTSSVSLSYNFTVSVAKDQCSYNLTSISSNVTTYYKCSQWTFDDEGRGTSTIATEWNLVCDEKFKIPLTSSIFFVGVFCGAFIFGILSDHLGRKKTLAICLYLQIPISVAVSFMPSYVSFTVLRFLLGVWLQGISTVAFVHCIEFFQQKYRSIVMTAFGMSWAFAQLLTALFGFVFPNWRHIQLAASTLALVTVPYFWWLPESPRWLLVKGRFKEIHEVFIRRAAKMNGKNVGEMVEYAKQRFSEIQQQQNMAVEPDKTQSFRNILKTPELLTRLIAMCYLWCVSSLAYYVFIFNTRNLSGNRYLNFALGAVFEIIVNLVIIFVMIRFGRKKPLLFFSSLCAIFCIVSGTIPSQHGEKDLGWLVLVFALGGRMCIAAVLCLIFVYAAELFPTFSRGSCLALCGCSLRIGGMVAPQILFLKDVVFSEFPYIVVAGLLLLMVVFTFFLPETLGKSMPNTIDEALALTSFDHSRKKKKNKSPTKEELLLSNSPTNNETITTNGSVPESADDSEADAKLVDETSDQC